MIIICDMDNRKEKVKEVHATVLNLLRHCSELYNARPKDEDAVVKRLRGYEDVYDKEINEAVTHLVQLISELADQEVNVKALEKKLRRIVFQEREA